MQQPQPEQPSRLTINRTRLEELLKHRFFYTSAFSIYGGVKGLYDYGPPGCAIKANLLAFWRQHFVLEENMLEVDCTNLTPHIVLKTSGHVDKFQDFMVRDTVTQECFRADHLLKDRLEVLAAEAKTEEAKAEIAQVRAQIDEFDDKELHVQLQKYGVKAPETANDLTHPFPFNLMFETQIGPTGDYKGYLRPETAQGIFVNFAKLLEFNGGKLPFAAAQIGLAFRNEIAPRSGLLRVREFCLSEIEHFVNPADKSHPKFANVANIEIYAYPRSAQMGDKRLILTTIGKAVESGMIANQTLGYYLGRTALFLWNAGIHKDKLRFRQHLAKEMAHYACDCWDAEILTSYGWIECVGHADRSAYDLTVHAAESKARLTAFVSYDKPVMKKVLAVKLDKGKIGKTFKGAAQTITKYLESRDEADLKKLQEQFASGKAVIHVDGKEHTLEAGMMEFTQNDVKISGENITPGVIEPSFGIGRIIYAILEHAFNIRGGDEQRAYLALTPIVAPVKCSILPLTGSERLAPMVSQIASLLTQAGISSKIDDSGTSVGRRYARTDEIGIPFGITIDFETVEKSPPTVTMREITSMAQIRVPISELAQVVRSLVDMRTTWAEVQGKYPAVTAKESDA